MLSYIVVPQRNFQCAKQTQWRKQLLNVLFFPFLFFKLAILIDAKVVSCLGVLKLCAVRAISWTPLFRTLSMRKTLYTLTASLPMVCFKAATRHSESSKTKLTVVIKTIITSIKCIAYKSVSAGEHLTLVYVHTAHIDMLSLYLLPGVENSP